MNSKEETALVLEYLGYEVDRAFKFRLRADEKTASASINPKNGKIKDFGSGWSGSVIDLMKEFHGYGTKEAFDKVSTILGDPSKVLNLSPTSHTQNSYKEGFITQEYIDKFTQLRKSHFDRFYKLLCEAMPVASKEQRKAIATEYEIGYCNQSDRLIMPLRDELGNCLTLWKYNKNPTPFMGKDGKLITMPKLIFTKNRRRCPFNLAKMGQYKQNGKPIFIMEGEKDCLNALARGLNAVSLGSASSKIDELHLPLFKDCDIVICYDYDEAGKNGAEQLKNDLASTAKSIEIIDWQQIAIKSGIKQIKQGFDFTDYLQSVQEMTKNKNIEQDHSKDI